MFALALIEFDYENKFITISKGICKPLEKCIYIKDDKDLSSKAKELLSFTLSLPEDQDHSLNVLVAISKKGIKSIRNMLE